MTKAFQHGFLFLILTALLHTGTAQGADKKSSSTKNRQMQSVDINQELEEQGISEEVAFRDQRAFAAQATPGSTDLELNSQDLKVISKEVAAPISFRDFLNKAKNLKNKSISRKVAAITLPLSSSDAVLRGNLFKVISLYAGFRHRNEIQDLLKKFVELNTDQGHRDIEWNSDPAINPNPQDPSFRTKHPFQAAGLELQKFTSQAGLIFHNIENPDDFICPEGVAPAKGFKNCSNKIYVIELPGKAASAQHPLGLYVHMDVVPAGTDWYLTNDRGQKKSLDPFKMEFVSQKDLQLERTREDLKRRWREAKEKEKTSPDKARASMYARYLERQINDITGDRYYGRGTIDDKAAIVSALFAMKTLRELQNEGSLELLSHPIQLIIETTEETTGEGVGVYLKWAKEKKGFEPTQQKNLGLDALYPISIAEKGIFRLRLDFPQKHNSLSGDQVEISLFHGANKPELQARNSIPGVFKITFQGPGAEKLKTFLQANNFFAKAEKFLMQRWSQQDNEKSILISLGEKPQKLWHPLNPTLSDVQKNSFVLNLHGYERVSFMPMDADNSLVRAAGFLSYLKNELAKTSSVKVAENHYTQLANFIWNEIGFDYYGKPFQIAFMDRFDINEKEATEAAKSFMGALTVVPTKVELPNTQDPQSSLGVYVDMRVPRSNQKSANDAQELKSSFTEFANRATKAFEAKASSYGYKTTVILSAAPRYVSPNQPWLQSLLKIFQTQSGHSEYSFISISGSSTASTALNGVNFGPTLPYENDVYHISNEFKKTDNIQLDLRMFTQAFLELAQ